VDIPQPEQRELRDSVNELQSLTDQNYENWNGRWWRDLEGCLRRVRSARAAADAAREPTAEKEVKVSRY
jgi:hypothetical protein